MTSLAEQVTALARAAPMPAVAVCVFDRQGVLARAVHGVADLSAGRPVTADEWWDLASLTKTLVTLPEVLRLVDDGRLALEQPLAECWHRAVGRPVGRATIADLLSHRSGLPATVPFFRTITGRTAVVDAALRAELTDQPRVVYSDLGFLLLGAMVEDLADESLTALARRRTGLRMGRAPGQAAATEHCPWRRRLIAGEVHDENAWTMGGVAGHAGAFGTLQLVSSAARSWLAEQAVSRELHAAARSCWAAGRDSERFGLGWWLAPTRGLGGPVAGPDGYGCSGFVGNRVWLEPSRGYGVVILSNRVHPRRDVRAPFAAWCDRLLAMLATNLWSQGDSNP
ncbi:serine hydrolase domain-containing protein [Micromonospora sp. LOL_021]|uniref:serine hydrolase domain-containing protein n=1 Tax=Micromonospora sp. LOL_021 TaxID=3345417 RepID=UPI003A89018B